MEIMDVWAFVRPVNTFFALASVLGLLLLLQGLHPDATADAIHADGLFRTGDIGRVDKDGDQYIVDRKMDLIIHGGHNV